jgi:hypothetical protein
MLPDRAPQAFLPKAPDLILANLELCQISKVSYSVLHEPQRCQQILGLLHALYGLERESFALLNPGSKAGKAPLAPGRQAKLLAFLGDVLLGKPGLPQQLSQAMLL